jgi:endoglucanase
MAGIYLFATAANAQNPAIPAYQGSQPELVSGVEEGLATGKPKLRHIYLATPDTVAITLHAQAIPILPMQSYVKKPGDTFRGNNPMKLGPARRDDFRNRAVVRNGQEIGGLIGPKQDHIQPQHQLVGEALDYAWTDNPANYSLAPDGGDAAPVRPTAVYRKNTPEMSEWVAGGVVKGTSRTDLYLKFPKPLTPGTTYHITLNPKGSPLGEKLTFKFDDARLRTEAIQVNQAGYHPRDPKKTAFLSLWIGSGGGVDFSAAKNFQIVDDATGKVVFTGDVRERWAGKPGQVTNIYPEKTPVIANPMSIHALDFSAFSTPGKYRIVIPGLGSSFPFRLDENVWTDVTKISAHGYLNQRSGMKLGAPWTKFERPRDMHPADGFKVHYTDPKLFFSAPAKGPNPFLRIQASILEDTSRANAWGGWHDAGDFDRSILPQQHTRAVHAMLDLFESNPAYFEKLSLNLPESGDKVPDLLDEALWCLDLYRRLQEPDGSVWSGIESIEHPNEPSFLLSQPTALIPATPPGNHMYAAAAAQMAHVLKKYAPARAEDFRESAIRAYEWAGKNPNAPDIFGGPMNPKPEQANLAAAHLYRLTGNSKHHDAFKRTLATLNPDGKIALRGDYGGPWGTAVYALLPDDQVDVKLREQCRAAILASADERARKHAAFPYYQTPVPRNWDERLGEPWDLVVAHRISGDRKYLLALHQLAQYPMGANPNNMSHTRGLGSRQITNFNLDAHFLGVALPDGITSMGPHPQTIWGAAGVEQSLAPIIYPAWKNWPWTESAFNVRNYALTEFTVAGVMTNQLLIRAYLAQELAR